MSRVLTSGAQNFQWAVTRFRGHTPLTEIKLYRKFSLSVECRKIKMRWRKCVYKLRSTLLRRILFVERKDTCEVTLSIAFINGAS
jgi:hypothetical protein